jgi:TolB protein
MSRLRHIERRNVIIALLAFLAAAPLGARNAAGSLRIAIPGFFGASPDDREKGHNLALLVVADLRDSGKFTPIDPREYSGLVVNANEVPRFSDWRALSADALVTGRISLQSDGRFKVEFQLWDVATGLQLYGAQYFVDQDHWNRIPHIVSDSIYERLIGKR